MKSSPLPTENKAFDGPLHDYQRHPSATVPLSDWNGLGTTKTEQSAIQAQHWLHVTATGFGVLVAVGIITGLIMDMN